jgi:hypothetical protein
MIAFLLSIMASVICVGALVMACETAAWGEGGVALDEATRGREQQLDRHFALGAAEGEPVAK